LCAAIIFLTSAGGSAQADNRVAAPLRSAVAGAATALLLPGVRLPRPETLTITDIRSNKVRYDENEAATTKATLVNTSGREFSGTLAADMILDETGDQFAQGDRPWRYPGGHLDHLCANRDYLAQKIRGSLIQGYIANYRGITLESPPVPDRWGWAAHNYLGAQHIATQHHVVSWFLPGWRPTLQFMTRYSRFLWAPDIKVVPEAEKVVSVTGAGADQVWGKRLVYRRDTADGRELIVHLVRIPPFEKWDLKWLDDPEPLDSVRLTVGTDSGTLRDVQSMRPYYWEEPQQPVQRTVESTVKDGRVEITVPGFRYHNMVVFRFGKVNR